MRWICLLKPHSKPTFLASHPTFPTRAKDILWANAKQTGAIFAFSEFRFLLTLTLHFYWNLLALVLKHYSTHLTSNLIFRNGTKAGRNVEQILIKHYCEINISRIFTYFQNCHNFRKLHILSFLKAKKGQPVVSHKMLYDPATGFFEQNKGPTFHRNTPTYLTLELENSEKQTFIAVLNTKLQGLRHKNGFLSGLDSQTYSDDI